MKRLILLLGVLVTSPVHAGDWVNDNMQWMQQQQQIQNQQFENLLRMDEARKQQEELRRLRDEQEKTRKAFEESNGAQRQQQVPVYSQHATTIVPKEENSNETWENGICGPSVKKTVAPLFARYDAEKENSLEVIYSLSLSYLCGWWTEKNEKIGLHYLFDAANNGYAEAMFTLGFLCGDESFGVNNKAEAFTWFKKAADLDDVGSMHNVAVSYWKGWGVPQNFIEAHKWFNLAAAKGDSLAEGLRDAVAEKMTKEQIAEAQRLAAEWRPMKLVPVENKKEK